MRINRKGLLMADVITASGAKAFQATQGLYYYERNGLHCIDAYNGEGKEFYVYLPVGIQTGTFSLGLSERSPMVIHVTDGSEAELYRGTLELTVQGDAQFAGNFSGLDADGVTVENGSFRLEYEAGN